MLGTGNGMAGWQKFNKNLILLIYVEYGSLKLTFEQEFYE